MKRLLNKYWKDVVIFCIPFLIFILVLLMYYPGIIPYDGNNQWQQVQNQMISNAHPFFSTYFMLLLSKIWNNPLIVILFQILVFSFSWMYMCNQTRNDKNFKWQVIYSVFVSFLPIICIYSITLWKDVLYSYYLMILAFLTYKIGAKQNFKIKISQFIVLAILLILIFSYRHNGMIVVCFYLLFISFLYFKYNKEKRKNIILLYLVFIVLLGIISVPKTYYLNKSNKSENDTDEKSESIINHYITWIFGEYLRDGIVSKKDKKFLNNISNVKTWGDVYSGYLINDSFVKNSYNNSYILKHENKYRQMFVKYTIKRPDEFIKHYLRSDSLLLSPISIEKGYVYVFPFNSGERYSFDGMINSKIPSLEKVYTNFINVTMKTPLKYLYQPAIILFGVLIIILILKRKNIHNVYLLAISMILNTVSLLPINLAQDLRYVYINYLTLFVLGLILLENNYLRKNKDRKSK